MPQPAVQPAVQPAGHFAADQTARPPAETARVAADQPTLVTLGERDVAWAASPARDLHARLVESFAPAPPHAEVVLSLRRRALILVGSAALLWTAIGVIGVALLA